MLISQNMETGTLELCSNIKYISIAILIPVWHQESRKLEDSWRSQNKQMNNVEATTKLAYSKQMQVHDIVVTHKYLSTLFKH